MAYEHDASGRVYPSVITDKTLMNIYVNEVLRLGDGDAPRRFRKEWKEHIESLTKEEKRAIYSFLRREASKIRKIKKEKEIGLARIVEDSNPEIKTLESDIKSYSGQITRLERGVEYLQKHYLSK